jgi:hypothetical protein
VSEDGGNRKAVPRTGPAVAVAATAPNQKKKKKLLDLSGWVSPAAPAAAVVAANSFASQLEAPTDTKHAKNATFLTFSLLASSSLGLLS